MPAENNLPPLRIPQAELIAWLEQQAMAQQRALAQQQALAQHMQATQPQPQAGQPQIPAQAAPLPRHHQQGGPLIPVPPPQPLPPPEWLARGTVTGDVARALLTSRPSRSLPRELRHVRQAQERLATPVQQQPLVSLALPGQPTHNPLRPIIPQHVAWDRMVTRPVLPLPPGMTPPPYRGTQRLFLPHNWLLEATSAWPQGAAISVGRRW